MPASCNSAPATSASRPRGAKMRTLHALGSGKGLIVIVLQKRLLPNERRKAAKDPLELVERFAEAQAPFADAEFPDRLLVTADPFLDDGNCAPDLAESLEISKQDERVRQVGGVNRHPHVADNAMLRQYEEGARPLSVKVLQQ